MGEKILREERILGLSRIWRDVKYCFARYYEVTSDEKWDALYCEYLPLVAEAEDNIGIIGFHVCTSDVKENLYQNAAQLKKCRGFLIDVRANSGGGDYASRAVASLFFEDPITDGRYFVRVINPWKQQMAETAKRN